MTGVTITESWTDTLLSLDALEDRRQWDALVSNSAYADTYYRPAYVAAYQDEKTRVQALLLHAGANQCLLPLAFRPLSNLLFAPNEAGVDVYSPYGYGGILALERPVSKEEGTQLVKSLQAWCKEHQVVSCFIRLHSLLDQHRWFEGLELEGAKLQYFGQTKTVELGEWDEEQAVPRSLPKGRREKTRWARRKLSVEIHICDQPGSEAALQQFIVIYNATMDRQNAARFYYFPDSYYHKLAQGLGRDMAIVTARHEGKPVAAGIFFADVKYAHYHLSGSIDEGRRYHAPAVIILKAAEWARGRGCERLHLGGGMAPNDSLFQFKDTFGGRTCEYHSLTVIGDRARYSDLLRRRLEAGRSPLRPNFFPEYRA